MVESRKKYVKPSYVAEPYTIAWWLLQLPDECRSKALLNHLSYRYTVGETGCSVAESLDRAFDWSGSPEGWHYWRDVRNGFGGFRMNFV